MLSVIVHLRRNRTIPIPVRKKLFLHKCGVVITRVENNLSHTYRTLFVLFSNKPRKVLIQYRKALRWWIVNRDSHACYSDRLSQETIAITWWERFSLLISLSVVFLSICKRISKEKSMPNHSSTIEACLNLPNIKAKEWSLFIGDGFYFKCFDGYNFVYTKVVVSKRFEIFSLPSFQ